jgi:hypothetical protein
MPHLSPSGLLKTVAKEGPTKRGGSEEPPQCPPSDEETPAILFARARAALKP